MTNQTIAAEYGPEVTDFVIPYPDEQEGLPEGIKYIGGCVDKNCPHCHDEVLWPFIYFQSGGGEHGVGVVSAIAIEAERPGETAGVPSYVYGKAVSDEARDNHGQLITFHKPCKAVESDITKILANDMDGRLVETAKLIEPIYASSISHEAIVLAAMRRTREMRHPSDIYRNLARPIGRMIARPAMLLDTSHRARAFLSIYEPDKAFDVKAAHVNDRNAYVVTRQLIVMLAPIVSRMFSVKEETVISAYGAFHAAIHKTLEKANGYEIPVMSYGTAV